MRSPPRTSSVVELDRSALTAHVEAPGVAVVHWRDARDPRSHTLDRTVERAAREYPDVRFGTVDARANERLAQDWAVDDLPTLMIYRDGTFLYTGSGVLPAGAMETLLDSALAMDLGTVRKGVNGHEGRFVVGFDTGSGRARGPANGNGATAGGVSDGGPAKEGDP